MHPTIVEGVKVARLRPQFLTLKVEGLIFTALHLHRILSVVGGVPACIDVRLDLTSGRDLGDEYAAKEFSTHTMQDFPGE